MTDLLQGAAVWLGGMLQRHASQPVVYRRGDDTIELAATLGRTQYEAQSADGLLEKRVIVDFLIPAASLVMVGQAIKPARGDRIEWTSGGRRLIYQVLGLPGGREYETDPFQLIYRIHTKLESEVAA